MAATLTPYSCNLRDVTATLLLSYILMAIALQWLVAAGFSVWRRHAAQKAPPGARVDEPAASTRTLAWSGWRDFRVVRRTFEDQARSQCSFFLAPVDGAALVPFKPGQFLTFQLQVASRHSPAAGPSTLTRCYSLSERPETAHYRITVKRVPAPEQPPAMPAGAASSHFHDHIQVGDVLQVKAPSGHFYLDADSQTPVVLIGGGIGITPMMSMLRWCLAEQPARTVHVVYGLRNGMEHAFKQTLAQLASTNPQLHLHVVYSRPRPADVLGRDYQHSGHVNAALLRQQLPHGPHQFYICGPAAMMETLVPELLDWGVLAQDVHFEAFGPASVRLPATDAPPAGSTPTGPVTVRFRQSGRTLPWDGQPSNLLDFAERHGVAVESGCRSGGCGSCQTRLISGTVRYANPPDHDPLPGHCLLCVAGPGTDIELDA